VLIAPVSKQIPWYQGNFTGNFAILGLSGTIEYQETAALQSLLEQFPTQIISENILKNSEFSNGIRELTAKLTPVKCFMLGFRTCRDMSRHQ